MPRKKLQKPADEHRLLHPTDFMFYGILDSDGRFEFKDERINIYRKTRESWTALRAVMPESELSRMIELSSISQIFDRDTRQHTLVYDIFEDFVEAK